MNVLSHLAAKGVRVPNPLAARSGKLVTVLQAPEGPRQLTVVEYLRGHEFASASDARDYGALVGQVHSELGDFASNPARRGPALDNLIKDAVRSRTCSHSKWRQAPRPLCQSEGTYSTAGR